MEVFNNITKIFVIIIIIRLYYYYIKEKHYSIYLLIKFDDVLFLIIKNYILLSKNYDYFIFKSSNKYTLLIKIYK